MAKNFLLERNSEIARDLFDSEFHLTLKPIPIKHGGTTHEILTTILHTYCVYTYFHLVKQQKEYSRYQQ